MLEMQIRSWVGKSPWRGKWQPTSVFLPKQKSHGQRSLAGYSLWSCKESLLELIRPTEGERWKRCDPGLEEVQARLEEVRPRLRRSCPG